METTLASMTRIDFELRNIEQRIQHGAQQIAVQRRRITLLEVRCDDADPARGALAHVKSPSRGGAAQRRPRNDKMAMMITIAPTHQTMEFMSFCSVE